MLFDAHKKNFMESDEIIKESIEKGISTRQRNIGFNASAAAIDMLEMLLHKKSLIDPGHIIKHEWFNSEKKIREKMEFDFDNKEEIIRLIKDVEGKRNLLCYGKPQKEETIKSVIDAYNKLKEKFRESGLDV